MRLLLAASAAISILAGPALAQAPAPAPAPAKPARTAQEIAAAKAAFDEGEAILKAANAADLFVNESAEGTGAILLRHTVSGFQCVMNPGGRAKVIVFPSPLPRGDDVGCDTQTVTDSRTIYFTRSSLSTSQEIAAAIAALKIRYPNVKPVPHPSDGKLMGRPLPPQAPKCGVAVFANGRAGERVDVGVIDGWAVKMRYSTPSPELAAGELLDIFWLVTAAGRSKPAA